MAIARGSQVLWVKWSDLAPRVRPLAKRLMGNVGWGRGAACLVVAAVLSANPAPLRAGSASIAETLPPTPYHPARGDSILVFGAHPDDETLGAGGFIAASTSLGARVTIAIFTNGDGYIAGLDAGYRTLFSTPAKFIEYGKARQQEALGAAARLGIPSSRVVFLGYPDRGLAVLWGRAWSCARPYTSPYTRRARSPYPLSYRAQGAYCGENVLEDVEALLRRERPTAVVVHHPADTHRDHWAADAFVTAALEHLALQGEPWAQTVRVFHYLVRHGAWPLPQTYAPDLSLWPPPDLQTVHSGWFRYPLAQTEEDAKRRAVLEYRSQTELLRTYMLSFVRRNELFDLFKPIHPPWVGRGALPLAAPELWDQLPSAIQLPASGSLLEAAEGSANLVSVAVAQDPDHLLIAVRLRKSVIREVQYRLELRLFYLDGRMARLLLRFRVPQFLSAEHVRDNDLALPPGAAARSFGRRIEMALPLASLGHPASVYLHVATLSPLRTLVDRTPWTMFLVEIPESGIPRP